MTAPLQLYPFLTDSRRGPTRLVKVRVTLRLAVYRQSIRLAHKPLKTHCQNIFSQLNACGYSPYKTSSNNRMGLSFTIAAGPRQHIHSPVQVPWESRQYFTVSD
jgi:hypothetical protein